MADLIDTSLTETVVNGFLQLEYKQTYQIISSSSSVQEFTVMSDAGLPKRAAPLVYDGVTMYCYQRVPRRSNADNERRKWLVDCMFSNDTSRFVRNSQGQPIPVDTAQGITNTAPQVDIAFLESTSQVREAEFLGLTSETGLSWPVQPKSGLVVNQSGPFVNSAGDLIEREQREWTTQITYWRYVRDWNSNWNKTVLGKANNASFTVQQTDADGVRFSRTFEPETLVLLDIIKQDVWIDGRLFFRVGFVLLELKEDTTITIPDEGVRRLVYSGQYRLDGTTFSDSDLTDETGSATGQYLQEIITPIDGFPEMAALVGKPMKLNGWGANVPIRRPEIETAEKTFYLKFRVIEKISFSSIGIT